METKDVMGQVRDAVTGRRVFGDPYEKEGVTVIPAAAVRGGGGGGGGQEDEARGGFGSGFGLTARPVGAFVIKDGDVRWTPAYDATRVALLGEILAIVALLVLRSVLRERAEESD